jgi:hypothetical protein
MHSGQNDDRKFESFGLMNRQNSHRIERCFGQRAFRFVRLLVETLQTRDEPAEHSRIAAEVRDICARFPVPGLPEA